MPDVDQAQVQPIVATLALAIGFMLLMLLVCVTGLICTALAPRSQLPEACRRVYLMLVVPCVVSVAIFVVTVIYESSQL